MDLEKFEEVVVGRELKMIALEKEQGAGEPAEGSREAEGGEGLIAMLEAVREDRQETITESGATATAESRLRAEVVTLEGRLRKGDIERYEGWGFMEGGIRLS